MKKLITAFVFVICAQGGISQTVTSSCSAPNSVTALYIEDADRLALKRIYQQNLSYTNSIVIPQAYTDTLLKALIAVYNATALPARTAVVSTYSIHTFPYPVMNRVSISADSNLTWMHQLRLGTIPTGNAPLDNLLSTYSLTIQNYNSYFGILPQHVVTFECDSNYNMPPLTNLFENIPGVAYSETLNAVGDGNNIVATIYPGYVELVYSLGWDDCPSGCIYRHYWSFGVSQNCTVDFNGEYGAPIPIMPTPTITVLGSNCTNETLTVTISGANSYLLNNQNLAVSQFTLSSPTPTAYFISAFNSGAYPAPTSMASFSVSITDCSSPPTSIKENKWTSGILMYPNPANEFIELQLTDAGLYLQEGRLSIYNQLAQLVKEEALSVKDGVAKLKTTDLENGVYVLTLSFNGSSSRGSGDSPLKWNRRFVINR